MAVRAVGMNPADFKRFAPGRDEALLMAGTTAAEMVDAASVPAGDTVLVHGAAGAVGVSALQQLRLAGIKVIGSVGPADFALVSRFGGLPVPYGPGLEDRVRQAAPEGLSAALDTVGSDEAVARLAGRHPSGKIALVVES